MKITDKFVFFWGTKDCFSQWHPCVFTESGSKYSSTEQFMMAEKARLFKDEDSCTKIMSSSDPRKIKSQGRLVKNWNEKLWNAHREDIVYRGNLAKFSQNPHLKAQLQKTGSRMIVEASPNDAIWGIGLADTDPACMDPSKWKGLNLLGKALMRVRETLEKQVAWEEDEDEAESAEKKRKL